MVVLDRNKEPDHFESDVCDRQKYANPACGVQSEEKGNRKVYKENHWDLEWEAAPAAIAFWKADRIIRTQETQRVAWREQREHNNPCWYDRDEHQEKYDEGLQEVNDGWDYASAHRCRRRLHRWKPLVRSGRLVGVGGPQCIGEMRASPFRLSHTRRKKTEKRGGTSPAEFFCRALVLIVHARCCGERRGRSAAQPLAVGFTRPHRRSRSGRPSASMRRRRLG